MDADRVTAALHVLYERYSDALEEEDQRGMLDAFARMCQLAKEAELRVPMGVFHEMRLAWAELFFQSERSDLAADVFGEHLAANPRDTDARLQYSIAMFHSCRFEAARKELEALENEEVDEPELYIYLAALAERDGDDLKAREYYRIAQDIYPDFRPPIDLSQKRAVALFQEYLKEAPEPIRSLAARVPIYCVALPSEEVLLDADPPLDPWLLGVFRGPHVGEGDVMGVVSPQIILFHKNIARLASDRHDLEDEMRRTIFHEIGHYAGMDEAQLLDWERALDADLPDDH